MSKRIKGRDDASGRIEKGGKTPVSKDKTNRIKTSKSAYG